MTEQVLDEKTDNIVKEEGDKKTIAEMVIGKLQGKKEMPKPIETKEVQAPINPQPQLTIDDIVSLAYQYLTLEQLLGIVKLRYENSLGAMNAELEKAKQIIYKNFTKQ